MKSEQMGKLLESSEAGELRYRRYSFQSEILQKEMFCGVLDFADQKQIQDTVRTTIYIFHGANGDDRQTLQAGLPEKLAPQTLKKLRELRAQLVLPLVEGSFLHDHPTDRSKSYYAYFTDEIRPRAEKGTLTQDSSRFLIGYSAGGQAALSTFFKTPEQFQGVGAHFPVFPTYDYNSPASVAEYIARTQANPAYVEVAGQCYKAVFVDGQDLRRHDPLTLIESQDLQLLSKKRIYLDVGSKDEFGLYEGCQMFHEVLSRKSIPHSFSNVPEGKHDAEFLQARFPELMSYLIESA